MLCEREHDIKNSVFQRNLPRSKRIMRNNRDTNCTTTWWNTFITGRGRSTWTIQLAYVQDSWAVLSVVNILASVPLPWPVWYANTESYHEILFKEKQPIEFIAVVFVLSFSAALKDEATLCRCYRNGETELEAAVIRLLLRPFSIVFKTPADRRFHFKLGRLSATNFFPSLMPTKTLMNRLA